MFLGYDLRRLTATAERRARQRKESGLRPERSRRVFNLLSEADPGEVSITIALRFGQIPRIPFMVVTGSIEECWSKHGCILGLILAADRSVLRVLLSFQSAVHDYDNSWSVLQFCFEYGGRKAPFCFMYSTTVGTEAIRKVSALLYAGTLIEKPMHSMILIHMLVGFEGATLISPRQAKSTVQNQVEDSSTGFLLVKPSGIGLA
ncbi:uncharacterized protein MYCFIDRAFT_175093 [Pseudocercospora fijiensis CIRAD86]|uniref:Uncharacterized protein n=1 Tax=Pseudocercospora fijiensis (strain CIRAD86) TaxID=383855 RepID=M3AGG0_PSEFD|nr:uncharacterized protein MYCFIDRAFT_175093 [Pseudocercospora fijiensis CIRAD86]EME83666.1 hypothetical protein MYCFIDRAFT_175093 [Pseudocercospora fijiensis CIRAD86]